MEGRVESGARVSRAGVPLAAAGLLCIATLTLAGPEPSVHFAEPHNLDVVTDLAGELTVEATGRLRRSRLFPGRRLCSQVCLM